MESLWALITTLSPENKRWIADKLREESNPMAPYTQEELHERIRKAEENIQNGNTVSHEEVMDFINDYIDEFENNQNISAYAS